MSWAKSTCPLEATRNGEVILVQQESWMFCSYVWRWCSIGADDRDRDKKYNI